MATAARMGGSMGRSRRPPDKSNYAGRFGARLRELRDRSGKTPAEIADRVGVTEMTVYNWETAATFPKVEQLPTLAKALGCQTIGELFPPR